MFEPWRIATKQLKTLLLIASPNRGWDGHVRPLDYPHTGLAYLSASVKTECPETRVVVLDLSHHFARKEAALAAAISKHQPDMVGISVYSSLVRECGEIAVIVRRYTNAVIVAGGPAISCDGETFLRENPVVDFGIHNEGEAPLSLLVQSFFSNRFDPHAVPNLLWRDGAQIQRSATPVVFSNIEKLPWPDFSCFDLSLYSRWGKRYPMVTSRGCPYHCTYCSCPVVTGRKFRARSPESVLAEMRFAYSFGVREFAFQDDAVNIDINRLKRICRVILAEGWKIRWSASSGIRANRACIDQELFALMRHTGCTWVVFGLESGSPKVLRDIRKGVTVDEVRAACSMARNAGMSCVVNLMIGHPTETTADAELTLDTQRSLDADYCNVSQYVPYPATKGWDDLRHMEAEGRARFLVAPADCMTRSSQTNCIPIFETDWFPAKEKERILRQAFGERDRKALRFRLGNVAGELLYRLSRNDLFRRLLESAIEPRTIGAVYQRLKRGGK